MLKRIFLIFILSTLIFYYVDVPKQKTKIKI